MWWVTVLCYGLYVPKRSDIACTAFSSNGDGGQLAIDRWSSIQQVSRDLQWILESPPAPLQPQRSKHVLCLYESMDFSFALCDDDVDCKRRLGSIEEGHRALPCRQFTTWLTDFVEGSHPKGQLYFVNKWSNRWRRQILGIRPVQRVSPVYVRVPQY